MYDTLLRECMLTVVIELYPHSSHGDQVTNACIKEGLNFAFALSCWNLLVGGAIWLLWVIRFMFTLPWVIHYAQFHSCMHAALVKSMYIIT